MAPPKGSRNNPNGRPSGDPMLRSVKFSVRIAPDIAVWIEDMARSLGLKESTVINDGLRLAMNRQKPKH